VQVTAKDLVTRDFDSPYPHKMQKTGQLSGFLHFVRVRSALRHFVGESKPFSHIFERQPLSLKNGKRVLRQ
jgi:hypothetical protein